MPSIQFDRGRGRGHVVGEPRRQRIVFQHADALAPLSFASRSPISVPGFGVLTISLSGSVVLIHSDTRFDSAVANTGAPVVRHQQQASDQYGVKPVTQAHRARPRVVGVDDEGVDAGLRHRGAQPREPRLERGDRQLLGVPSHQSAAHDRFLTPER